MPPGSEGGPTTAPGAIDPATMRFLAWHEACAHAIGGREVRDLGDAVLLHDPRDDDPFWNRVSAIRLPEDPAGFDRRLDDLLGLFAGLRRRPHAWVSPLHDTPADLPARLAGRGFVDLGAGLTMLLRDPSRAVLPPGATERVTLERHRCPAPGVRGRIGSEVAAILVAAFRVDPFARHRLAADLEASFASPELTVYVARVGATAVAAAKRTTFDGATYLSSIGTRPGWQGRGLGTLVTVAAVQDGLAESSHLTYLGVFADNLRALSLYERLGFVPIDGPAGDWLIP